MKTPNKNNHKFSFIDWLWITLTIVLAIVLFPISIPLFIISETKINRDYKFLKVAGFKSKRNKLLGDYNWIKHNICISYFHDHRNQIFDYKICLNYDMKSPVFKSLYDWQIGTEQEIDTLKASVARYGNASSLELQKDEPDREVEILHRDFIKLHLDEILHGGTLYKLKGQETTDIPIYYTAERFFPTKEYIEFSLIDRQEIVTHDCCLCSEITPKSYGISKKSLSSTEQIIAVFKNPAGKISRTLDKGFEFCGYDLSEEQTMISAITNCGELFENTIDISDINEFGILSSWEKAIKYKELLSERFSYEPHANCELYELWRKIN